MTMVVVHFIIVGVLLVILQTTIFMRTPISLLSPDLHYVLVAYLAFRLDLLRSLIILFPLVCVLDVLSGMVLGMYALSCFGGYFLLRQVSTRLPVNEVLYQIPLIALSFIAISWAVYLFLNVFAPGQQIAWSWWKMVVRMALVAVATYPLFLLFDLLQKYSRRSFLPWNKLRLRSDNQRRRAA
jgi:rod shape-determining protein MreD